MTVRWSDVNAPRLETFPVFGQLRLKRLVSAQSAQQRLAGVVRRHVLDDEDGCRQVGGQLADKLVERFQPSGGRADNDDVASPISAHPTATFLALLPRAPAVGDATS